MPPKLTLYQITQLSVKKKIILSCRSIYIIMKNVSKRLFFALTSSKTSFFQVILRIIQI